MIANEFGESLSELSVVHFSDGEFEPSFDETVRGANVFLIQSTPPPSDNLMELLLMIDAAKRTTINTTSFKLYWDVCVLPLLITNGLFGISTL